MFNLILASGKAVQLGNRDVIYALIREIPDFVNRFSEDFCSVNAVDKYARTPLHYACDKDPNENFIDVICLLLGAGNLIFCWIFNFVFK